MITLDAKMFEGKQFEYIKDPSVKYTYAGCYDGPGIPLVVGVEFDSTNNRTIAKTFKLTEVKFIGKIF